MTLISSSTRVPTPTLAPTALFILSGFSNYSCDFDFAALPFWRIFVDVRSAGGRGAELRG
jgi:hypothetical protein